MLRQGATVLTATWIACAAVYAAPPLPPTVNWPPIGAVVGSNRLDLTWTGGSHDMYEIHIGSNNIPVSANVWNSGQVAASVSTAQTPALAPQQTCYIFIRLHNSDGWGGWSAAGQWFYLGAEFVNDPYLVAGPDGAQWPHSLCFNPDRNEYLIAYNDEKTGLRWNISCYRLNSLGQRLGSEVTITSDLNLDGTHEPSVVYNSVNQEYFIFYSGWDEQPSLHDEIRGQRVNAATGALIGTSFNYASFEIVFEPEIIYSPTSNCYLAAWHYNAAGQADIGTLRISGATGAALAGVVNLTAAEDLYSAVPAIAFNSSTDEFLVVWQTSQADANGWNQYARIVRASDGALPGSTVPINTSPVSESNGDVVYVPSQNRYMLVYESAGVWGQFLLPSGAPIGSRFQIDGPAWSGGNPKVSWNPTMQEFLVTWMACCSYDNWARRISSAGTAVSEGFSLTGSTTSIGIGNWNPESQWNATQGEYLIAWFNSYNDVYVRRYKPYAVPPADVTPPASATGLTLTRYANSMGLSWTNPATADFAGTMIRVKTTGYPTGPTDGLLVVDAPNAPSTTDTFLHTGLARGTYYYAAFAHDEVPNFAAAALAQAAILPGDFNGDTDIDQSDFGHIQVCLSGDTFPYVIGCRDADLDGDSDVDGGDMNAFISCMGGADLPPGC